MDGDRGSVNGNSPKRRTSWRVLARRRLRGIAFGLPRFPLEYNRSSPESVGLLTPWKVMQQGKNFLPGNRAPDQPSAGALALVALLF